MMEMCGGCQRRPIGKGFTLTGTTLCRRCAGGSKSVGRPRKKVELRISKSVSVDPNTAAAFNAVDVKPGEVLDAFAEALRGSPELLARLVAETRNSE